MWEHNTQSNHEPDYSNADEKHREEVIVPEEEALYMGRDVCTAVTRAAGKLKCKPENIYCI